MSDLVIVMADLMTSCSGKHEPLTVARLLAKGYLKAMELNREEISRLKLLICARLLQTFVLSGEALRAHPENDYAGLERKESMELCKHLWRLEDSFFSETVLNDKN